MVTAHLVFNSDKVFEIKLFPQEIIESIASGARTNWNSAEESMS